MAAATLLGAAGCNEFEDVTAADDTVRRSNLETPLSQPDAGGLDPLTTYAARCEAATGIHVPTINCLAGVEIPQGSSFDAVEVDVAIPSTTIGGRTVKPPAPVPPNAPANLVQNIQARGTIGGAADSFFYSYAAHSGNTDTEAGSGTIEVKVNSSTPSTNTNAKAGLMLRQSTAPDSAFVMIAVTPGRTVVFQSRTTTGGTVTQHASTQMANFPVWLRLMWDGGSAPDSARAAGAVSSDGVTWTPFGDITFTNVIPPGGGVPFPFEGLMGLAVASHNAASTTTAAFDKFVTSKYCDRPNVLEGRCDPRSRFQVAAETADAIVVANCRKGGSIDPGTFKDMAVIQYNRQNGAICFYQSPQGAQNGTALTTPGLGNGTGQFPWLTPGATRDVGCTNCHDNGPFVRSLYLYQLSNFPTSGYNNRRNKLRYVGRDFWNDRSWWIDPKEGFSLQDPSDAGDPCTSCHTLSTNNVPIGSAGRGGSAFDLAQIATGPSWTSKNPNSVESPIWMRPEQNTFYPPAQLSAANFGDCASKLAEAGYDLGSPILEATNCAFEANGVAYQPTLVSTNDSNIGTTGGTATGSLESSTLIAPVDTDVFGTSDKFFWTYAVQGGDGAAVVKVTRLDASNPYAKAGIMVRNGTGANAVNAMIAVTATQGATFQYRPTAGAATTTAYVTPRSVPIWLRLARSGRTWVGSVSTDAGNNWTQVGQPVTLVDLVTDFVGLVATSHNPSQTNRADFESFEWTPATGWTGDFDPHILVDGSIGASTGSRAERRGEETIVSSGGDIYGTSDAFQYAFKTFGGDGVLTTQVTSQTPNTGTIDPYAKAGIMFRETAAANSANVFLGKTPSGVTVQQRTTTGGSTNVTNVSASAVPTWFRLIRTRNTFIGSMSTNGTTWTQVGDPVVFTNFLSSPLVGLAVSSHSANAVTAKLDTGGAQSPPGMTWTYGIPAGWLDATMGMTGGSHTSTSTTEVITASGADIYGYSDQFFFAFQNVTGNAQITARVDSLALVTPPAGTINPYAKAGVMFRDSATGGSPNAFMAITAAQGATFQYRSTAGGNTPTPVFATGVAAPYWVRVTRTGASNNVYTGYRSSNGTTWTQVGTVTMSTIGQTALVGMAVTSHDASRSVTGSFSNVTIQPL